jgi:hypothetical protein
MRKLATLLLVFCQLALADGVPFAISSASLPPSPDDVHQTALIARLKYQAVADYLQRLMGNRFSQVENQVTPDFTERFVLDYQVNRSGRNALELSGHLDSDALKRWVRVTETKAAGASSLKPAFILSSTFPGMTVQPKDTATRVHDMVVGQTLFALMSAVFSKVNAHLSTISDGGLSLSEPPKRDSDFRALREYGASAGRNAVAWVHLSACKGCGTRVDMYLYNLTQNRLIVAKSEQVALDSPDFGSPERIRGAVREMLHDFSSDFEDSISSGTLFSAAYRLTVEGVDSYRAFVDIENGLGNQDFIVQAVVKHSEPNVAEFQVLSPLGPRELSAHFNGANFGGFALKPVRVDSGNLVVRYLK